MEVDIIPIAEATAQTASLNIILDLKNISPHLLQ